KLVHGDIKLANILLNVEDTKITAGFTDFGHAVIVEKRLGGIVKAGFYGTIIYSAPEFFGANQFSGNLYAVDIWAFGCMLYELVFGYSPRWQEIGAKYYHTLNELDHEFVFVVDSQDLEEMRKVIQEEIEEPRTLLLKQDTLTFGDKIKLFV